MQPVRILIYLMYFHLFGFLIMFLCLNWPPTTTSDGEGRVLFLEEREESKRGGGGWWCRERKRSLRLLSVFH